MTIREQTQQIERETLSSHAAQSAESRGRAHAQEECPIRTPFQRDRDRIIHCNSFRRLMHKTQVFLFPQGDHYRTRLTHTLEVSQIARTIARALRLNEDLTEAIALGHDLGHTPFGHAGEYALREVSPIYFRHAEQSVRVCEKLERDGAGLNLTFEVLDGIGGHSDGAPWAQTAEGRVVRLSDKIAYVNHDIEDAVRAGVLSYDSLPRDCVEVLGDSKSRRITTLVGAVIAASQQGTIGMEPQTEAAFDRLKAFMFEAVYKNPVAKGEEGKAKEIVRALYTYFEKQPDRLPADYAAIRAQEGVPRAVVDYLSGMSDRYCIAVYEDLYIPKPWRD